MQLHLKNNPQSTPVPNRFIECCGSAPEKYVSSYLLGLMYSSNHQEVEFSMFCARLGMDENDVIDAFEYWQKKGLARIINSDQLCFEFGDFSAHTEDNLYTERAFNQKLQKIFGSRQLSPHEYLKIYDYTDTFGLNKKVVLALVEYCVMKKGRRVSIAYLDKVAKTWAEEDGIDTEDKAREKIASYGVAASGILSVLARLGISKRSATEDEIALFEKWISTWGFTLEAVLTACAHTTAAREPSMKYLDRILERLYADGSTTSRQISERKDQSDTTKTDLQSLLHIIGEPSRPSFEYESLYLKWKSVYGFGMDMLTLAAKISGTLGRKPFVYLDDILTDWYNNRISTVTAAKAYMAEKEAQDAHISTVFEAAGIPRRMTDAHRKNYARWHNEWGLGQDTILLAAEISTLSDNPYRYLNTILSNWHDAGVKTLADAQQQTQQHGGNKDSTQVNLKRKYLHYERSIENSDPHAIDFFKDEGA